MFKTLTRLLVHRAHTLTMSILGPRFGPLAWQFGKFGLVGVVGLITDASSLYAVMRVTGTGPYLGRVFSFLCGATSTWFLNRTYTFQGAKPEPLLRQWARFLAANAVGGLVNYTTFALLVSQTETVAAQPLFGVAAGSVAGMMFNFVASKKFVFRQLGDAPSQGEG